MTNIQLFLSIGIPSLLVMINIAVSRSDIATLRNELNQLRSDIQRDMNQLRTDIHRDMNTLRTDLTRDMTQLRDSIHADMIGLHERVAIVEAKQSR